MISRESTVSAKPRCSYLFGTEQYVDKLLWIQDLQEILEKVHNSTREPETRLVKVPTQSPR